MAWLWFIIVVALLIYEFRAGLKLALFQRTSEAVLNSLGAIIVESGVDPEKAAREYIDNLGATLLVGDYDKFMKGLCENNGLRYRTDRDGYVIDEELKRELARRLGRSFTEAQKIVSSGR